MVKCVSKVSEHHLKILIWLLMALSSIVMIEPSPSDILITITLLFNLSLFIRYLPSLRVPAFFQLLFIISNVISTFGVENIDRGVFFLGIRIYLVFSWFLFIFITKHFGRKGVEVIFSGYIFAAILAVILGFLAFLHILPWEFLLVAGRPKALFKDPNVFGPFLVPVALYAIFKFESSKKQFKLWWIMIFLLTSLGVAISFSRGAWVNYFVGICIYFCLRVFAAKSGIDSVQKILSYASLIAILLLVSTSLLFSQEGVADFFTHRSTLQDYDSDRFSGQERALEIGLSSFVGIGPGQSEIVAVAPHNVYIKVLLENSWLGVFSYFGLFIITLYRSLYLAIRGSNDTRGLFALLAASILGILANSLVIDTNHWRHVWLILALPWGIDSSFARMSKSKSTV